MTLDSITDVAGIKVGHWTNRQAATGCTVVLYSAGAVGGVDQRGAAPGTRETDVLRPENLVQTVNAVLLTGGSTFGLDAAGGVMRWCEEQGFGIGFGGATIPIVPAAVVFDLAVGRADVRPDFASGYAASASARAGAVKQGSVGAGTGATVAKARGRPWAIKGGVGTASELAASGLVVAALAVVNAVGEVFDGRAGKVIAGPRSDDGGFLDSLDLLRQGADQAGQGENTTIGVVATNARLSQARAQRLATAAQDGIARAVRPAHTMTDGDTIFAMATGERELSDDLGFRSLEAFAALAMERAIVKGILAASSLAGVPAVADMPQAH